jgi:hypothetical protein
MYITRWPECLRSEAKNAFHRLPTSPSIYLDFVMIFNHYLDVILPVQPTSISGKIRQRAVRQARSGAACAKSVPPKHGHMSPPTAFLRGWTAGSDVSRPSLLRTLTMDNIEALVFDVFGTVVDWRGSVINELVEQSKKYPTLSLGEEHFEILSSSITQESTTREGRLAGRICGRMEVGLHSKYVGASTCVNNCSDYIFLFYQVPHRQRR